VRRGVLVWCWEKRFQGEDVVVRMVAESCEEGELPKSRIRSLDVANCSLARGLGEDLDLEKQLAKIFCMQGGVVSVDREQEKGKVSD
jgi:hypothetical protein